MQQSAQLKLNVRTREEVRSRAVFIALIAFSALYLIEVCLRAQEKPFWYDELLVVYFARLPDLHALWEAVTSGVDFCPPPFYVLTRAIESVFGEGPITARIPPIFGFLIFCLSMFRFVRRRVGPVGGATAMLFPMVTGAFYYAYEARPHGLVLGFCGLALVSWQMAVDEMNGRKWLAAFSLALFGALMVHCYALLLFVPFAIAEVFRTIRRKVIEWPFWLALCAPLIPAYVLYAPLLRSYRKFEAGSSYSSWFPPNWSQIQNFYSFLLSPCALIILAILIIFIIDRMGVFARAEPTGSSHKLIPMHELVLALSFIALPVFGILLMRIVHGTFFVRYLLSALSGFCILLGIGAGARGPRSWVAVTLFGVMVGTLSWSFLKLAWHRYNGWSEYLKEPSIGLIFEATPGHPLASHPLLLAEKTTSLPIVVMPGEFEYLVYYSPGDFSRHLWAALPTKADLVYRLLSNFREHCGFTGNPPLTYSEIKGRYREFLVYGDLFYLEQFSALKRDWKLAEPMKISNRHFLAHIRSPELFRDRIQARTQE